MSIARGGSGARVARIVQSARRRAHPLALLPAVPSGPTRFIKPRPIRLVALLAVRDDSAYLPGFLANVAPQVDGIVALDDGSTDGSAELLASSPAVLELIRVEPSRPRWDEVGNFRRLVAAGIDHGAEWLLSVDADERLERDFRARLERVIARGRVLGLRSYQVRLRELWDSREHYRVDGVWGRKTRPRVFAAREGHVFNDPPLHGMKAPLESRRLGFFPVADLELYHLRMIRREDRLLRRRRYEEADPDARWQPLWGYAYLTDERGLKRARVRPERAWTEALGRV